MGGNAEADIICEINCCRERLNLADGDILYALDFRAILETLILGAVYFGAILAR